LTDGLSPELEQMAYRANLTQARENSLPMLKKIKV